MKEMVVILCIVVLGVAFLVTPVAANNVACHEDLLRDMCNCNACTAAINLQVTPTCDGLELTWNDNAYGIVVYEPNQNLWGGGPIFGTSFFVPNEVLNPGTYSFAVLSQNSQSEYCYSNIVCDVEVPTTCPNIPEFPSMFLPVAMIIGFIGAVLYINRTREH
jgi:hypothetical protein